MPIFDHAERIITCKLVYYGPSGSGKSSTFNCLHSVLPTDQVSELTSIASRRARSLFFDYMPAEIGAVGAYRVRFQLCTVPGQSENSGARDMVLQGADAIAFVADSRRAALDANIECLRDLHVRLAAQDISARALPFVFQFNKQDARAEDVVSRAELSEALNFRNAPEFCTSSATGSGVVETLRSLCSQVLRRLGASDGADSASPDAEQARGDANFKVNFQLPIEAAA